LGTRRLGDKENLDQFSFHHLPQTPAQKYGVKWGLELLQTAIPKKNGLNLCTKPKPNLKHYEMLNAEC
jgi:hypothetical protein